LKINLEESSGEIVGTGTPGYWINHPEAWPVDEIEIGGMTYSREEAIDEMSLPVKKDKWYSMFRTLAAAKLNTLSGTNPEMILDALSVSDLWMELNYHLSGGLLTIIRAKSEAWKEIEPVYMLLDEYNNGLLEGAPSRDTL